MTRFVLLLIFLLVASSAKAQTPNLTGNWLYTVCATSDQQGEVICKMWISGFQAGIISSQTLAQRNKLKLASCIPNALTADHGAHPSERLVAPIRPSRAGEGRAYCHRRIDRRVNLFSSLAPPTRRMNSNRHFPPPWSDEEQDACFVVRDHGGQLAYVYFEDEPGTVAWRCCAWRS
jgi:hypothetical protein